MPTRIDVLLFDGFDELDAVGPFETFQNAAGAGADCEVSLVTRDPQDRVTASHGLDVGVTGRSPAARGASLHDVDGTLAAPDEADAPDLLVVPGGGWAAGEGGVHREYQAGDLPPVIAAHHEAGATVASVCTGAMLLERAGLLGDGPAITHQSAVDDLREAGVDVPDARVVDTDSILTAGGVTSGIDLALYLVEREFGAEIADDVATTLEYERTENVLVVA